MSNIINLKDYKQKKTTDIYNEFNSSAMRLLETIDSLGYQLDYLIDITNNPRLKMELKNAHINLFGVLSHLIKKITEEFNPGNDSYYKVIDTIFRQIDPLIAHKIITFAIENLKGIEELPKRDEMRRVALPNGVMIYSIHHILYVQSNPIILMNINKELSRYLCNSN